MALKGVLRPGYIQIRVTDLDAALKHYVDRVGLHEVSREADGRAYLRAWDEFDRHSVVLRKADMPGMDYVGFKVASEVELDSFARRIEAFGTKTEEVPAAGRWTPAQLPRPDRSSYRVVRGDGVIRQWADDQQS
jgi:catechol 2,3-dioxygenase